MIQQSIVASVQSVALPGYDGVIVEVETDTKAGLPLLQIVGMGNKAIDEARQRVRSAITNSNLEFPKRKVTVNLAPAELPKDGTHLDLPIALSILVASGQLKSTEVKGAVFAGELALNGSIRPIRGTIAITEAALNAGASTIFLPLSNTSQAHLLSGIEIIGVPTLQALFQHLKGITSLASNTSVAAPHKAPPPSLTVDDIVGHERAKRALVIAAAGRHNLLLCGSPGVGKTMLAKTLTSLLPPLTQQEVLEVTKLHSLSATTQASVITSPPLRAPHHSITPTALIGGGSRPRPGDISLAHKGVLFLDELPEYKRTTLEALRQPLEDKTISLSRLHGYITYPADIQLIATMNPCPCGFSGDTLTQCTCSTMQINHYKHRISGPLLDRIDLRLIISKTNHEHFFSPNLLQEKQHYNLLKLVLSARAMQKNRYKRSNFYNAYATYQHVKSVFKSTPAAQKLLQNATATLNLSSRASLRILRVARTIADIEGSHQLDIAHIAEALQFRDTP